MDVQYLESLPVMWTAEILLKNEQIISIWWTALPSTKNEMKQVVSVTCDYPKRTIK